MKRILAVVLVAAFACLGALQAAEEQAAKPVRTLFITGNDVGAHKWRETTPALREQLEKSGRFAVKVSEDPNILESEDALEQYDLLILNYVQLKEPPISDKAKENLLEFVKDGKGLVSFHMSSSSWQDWEAWHDLVGRWWKFGTSGHGPRGVFKAQVVKEHAITRGVPKEFDVDDELYAKLLGEGEIDVLVSAYSDWSKKTEPLVFTLTPGKGRVVNYAFGHDVKALADPVLGRLWVQSAEWAATGDVK